MKIDRLEKLDEHAERTCNTCKHCYAFVSVCCNGDSEHRGDFRNADQSCEHWEGYNDEKRDD